MVGHDVDTDQIYHEQYSLLSNSAEMAKHAMEEHIPGLECQIPEKGGLLPYLKVEVKE
jgi:3-isopropylmalate dehydratase small subunit